MFNFKFAAPFLAALCLYTNFAYAKDSKPTIIFIPLDNRPVCASIPKDTLEAAGCTVIMPPEKYIADNIKSGDPEKIWEWLENKAPKADAAVISTDTLIYGGLVASRTHNYSQSTLEERVNKLTSLQKTLPIKIYAFSTIMRTPRASYGNVEPEYYSVVGPAIFKYSQLIDKANSGKLNLAEQLTQQALERNMHKEDLGDWLDRRQKNLTVNLELAKMTSRKNFHYLAIGKDDNAPLSATHMEARLISWETFNMPDSTFQILPGVDQLGLLLLTRAYNETLSKTPKIMPVYSEGVGAGTLPQYSDTIFYDSVPQQIIAAGAVPVTNIKEADLVLALNTPYNGVMQDSTADSNQFFASVHNKNFIKSIKNIANNGKKISLADVSYSNGADNGFMNALANEGLAEKLSAYNGWNTADNTVGYAVSQGILALDTPPQKLNKLIKQRIIDDWYYQSNARRKVSDLLDQHSREDLKYKLGPAEKPVLNTVYNDTLALCSRYDFTRNTKFELSFPWNRLFEIDVKIKNK